VRQRVPTSFYAGRPLPTDYIQYHRSLWTFRTYRPILKFFGDFCSHTYVDEMDRATIMEFATHCLKQGQNGKTIYNKLVVIRQLLKQHGRTKIVNASDWPSFVQTVRPIYEDGELVKLFKACTPSEEIRFKFYLMSGSRRRGPFHYLARRRLPPHRRPRYGEAALGV
jgi:integrase/recombinase XerD